MLIKDLADIAYPVAKVIDSQTGKERYVDWDGIRSMHIRGIRERVAVTLQHGNAVIVRAWARHCFTHEAVGSGGHFAGA